MTDEPNPLLDDLTRDVDFSTVLGVGSFDVDPEAIRGIGLDVRDGIHPLVTGGAAIPEADAGLMTVVVEKAIATLLQGLVGVAAASDQMSHDIVDAALRYHRADQAAQANLARVLMPWTSEQEASSLVADAPGSTWDRIAEERAAPHRSVLDPNHSSSPPDSVAPRGVEGLFDVPPPPTSEGTGGSADAD